MSRLKGKSILISGAAQGIGRAAAGLFAREGGRIVIADLAAEAGARAAGEIQDAGGEAYFIQTDVTSESDVQRAVEATVSRYGRLDVLHNNAGGSTARDGMITEAPTEEFWRAIGLNLFSVWAFCRYAIPHMAQGGGGSIVNMASVAALRGLRRIDAYTAAKGGVVALTRSLAVEYAGDKIRVNAIAPTKTLTERVIELQKVRLGAPGERNLLGPAEPIDIARMALYLASDESSIVTGQVFAVDSGFTAG